MPGDGWHFRAAQMDNPAWRDIPVIVSTAIGKRPHTMAPELAVPEDHYLLKPMDFDALLAMLRRYSAMKSGRSRGNESRRVLAEDRA